MSGIKSIVVTEFLCFIEIELSFIVVAEFLIADAAIIIRRCVIRSQLNNFIEVDNGLRKVFQHGKADCSTVQSVGVSWIKFNGFGIICNRRLEIFQLTISLPAIVKGVYIIRSDFFQWHYKHCRARCKHKRNSEQV